MNKSSASPRLDALRKMREEQFERDEAERKTPKKRKVKKPEKGKGLR